MCFNLLYPLISIITVETVKKNIQRLEQAEKQHMEDFAQQHAPVTTAFHKEWKSRVETHSYSFNLDKTAVRRYSSYQECERNAKDTVQQAYVLANQYMTVESSKSVSKTVAREYAENLQAVFLKSEKLLESCCEDLDRIEIYEKVQQMVMNSEANLRNIFEEELSSSQDYYQMYLLDYFYDKIDIVKIEKQITKDDISRQLEVVLADNIHYECVGIEAAISELEKDLNEKLTTFYRRAYMKYIDYIGKMETLLDTLDRGFIEKQEKGKYINDRKVRAI